MDVETPKINSEHTIDVYPNGLYPSINLDGSLNPILEKRVFSTGVEDNPEFFADEMTTASFCSKDNTLQSTMNDSSTLSVNYNYGFDVVLLKPIIDLINEKCSLECYQMSAMRASFAGQSLTNSFYQCSAAKDNEGNEEMKNAEAIQLDKNYENVFTTISNVSKLPKFLLKNEVAAVFRRFHLLSIYTNMEYPLDHKRTLIPRTMNIGIQITNAHETSAEVLEAFRALVQQVYSKNIAYPDQTNFIKTFEMSVENINDLQELPYTHKGFKIVTGENVDHLNTVLDSLISCVRIVITKVYLIENLQKANIQKPRFSRFIGSK